jgi:peptide/nickel transport system permease protein
VTALAPERPDDAARPRPGRRPWDAWTIAAASVIGLLVLVVVFGNLLVDAFGQPVTTYNDNLISHTLLTPLGPFGGISRHHLLGVAPRTGKDVFSQLVLGARVSLGVGVAATALSVLIGVPAGLLAGYRGGWVDAVISRLMDALLALPLLIFAIAMAVVLQGRAFGLSGNSLHLTVLVLLIGCFGWPYVGRIVRGQALALRERDFVAAARGLGASTWYVLWHELLPNLAGPVVVSATLLIPVNIVFATTLDYLTVGVRPPTPSWGQLLADSVNYYTIDPTYLLVPAVTLFVSVLSFNVLGDGLRRRLTPRSAG